MREVPKRKVKLYHKYRVYLKNGSYMETTFVLPFGRKRDYYLADGGMLTTAAGQIPIHLMRIYKREILAVVQLEEDNFNRELALRDCVDKILGIDL